jgi:hypothetical protein
MLEKHFDPDHVYVVFLVQNFLNFGDLRIRVMEDPFQEALKRAIKPIIRGNVTITFGQTR